MTHRNTPAQDTGVSPAVLLFGRPLKDHLPRPSQKLREEWEAIADRREDALARRVSTNTPGTGKELHPLNVGDSVQIQNQIGNRPNKWRSTGIVSEALPNRQYHVITDGSRRVTLRNRRFLKKISPVCRKTSIDYDVPSPPPTEQEAPRPSMDLIPHYSSPRTSEASPAPPHEGVPITDIVPAADVPPREQSNLPAHSVRSGETTVTRRSTRDRAPRKLFNARMDGKYHDS